MCCSPHVLLTLTSWAHRGSSRGSRGSRHEECRGGREKAAGNGPGAARAGLGAKTDQRQRRERDGKTVRAAEGNIGEGPATPRSVCCSGHALDGHSEKGVTACCRSGETVAVDIQNVLCCSHAFAAKAAPVRVVDVRKSDDCLCADVPRQHSKHGRLRHSTL